jgi:hypothetical protein
MGRDRTRIERLEQLNQQGGPVTDVTGTAPIVVTTPSAGVRNVSVSTSGFGSVSYVNITSDDGSIVVSNSPITSAGTIDLSANTGLGLLVNSRIDALQSAVTILQTATSTGTTDPLVIHLTAEVFGD